jgi:hypothetical protein
MSPRAQAGRWSGVTALLGVSHGVIVDVGSALTNVVFPAASVTIAFVAACCEATSAADCSVTHASSWRADEAGLVGRSGGYWLRTAKDAARSVGGP